MGEIMSISMIPELQQDKENETDTNNIPENNVVTAEELWPGAKDIFHEIEKGRDYSEWIHDLHSEKELLSISDEVKTVINSANSFSDTFEVLKRVDSEVFELKWDGREIKGSEYWFYDDFPLECDDYSFCMQNILLPVLHKMEDLLINSNEEEKTKAVEELTNHILENYEYDEWYFDRAKEVCTTMLKIDGIKALPKVKEVTEYITEIPKLSDDDIEELEAGGIFTDYQDNESCHDPIFLEFDDPAHRQFTDPATKLIANYPWREGEEKEVSKFLAEYLSVNSHGNLNIFVEAFQKFGIENATKYLLNNLKSEDVLTRRMSAEILYRLELGKIGVNEDGVKYLGQIYDLGKYNDPDFFVRRLNNSGLMAILAENGGNIEGVFPLDLYADGGVVRAEIRQIMSQELFLPKADETPQQRQQREYYLQLFLENYENIFNDDFFIGTNVRLNSLDLHEQGWFLLNYLELSKQENTKELGRLKNFVSEYGDYGLKSFLALEYGGSGQEILDFAESTEITKEEKLAIFKNFYGIANEALNWRNIFGHVEKGVGYEFAPQVHEAFVRKNAEFFKAAQIIARGEGSDVTMGELLRSMNMVTFSLRALKGIYEENSNLYLEQKPQIQDEYDKDGNLIESALSSFVLVDKGIGARVVVSVRPNPTVRQGNVSGGEARINFSVTNLATKERARIGFDLSDYGESIGDVDKSPAVSLDIGVGKPDRDAGIWPSQRVGRILELVEGSEGGHNELSFRPEVAEHFPEIAETFERYLRARFIEQI
jgi:hypothetical protein